MAMRLHVRVFAYDPALSRLILADSPNSGGAQGGKAAAFEAAPTPRIPPDSILQAAFAQLMSMSIDEH